MVLMLSVNTFIGMKKQDLLAAFNGRLKAYLRVEIGYAAHKPYAWKNTSMASYCFPVEEEPNPQVINHRGRQRGSRTDLAIEYQWQSHQSDGDIWLPILGVSSYRWLGGKQKRREIISVFCCFCFLFFLRRLSLCSVGCWLFS